MEVTMGNGISVMRFAELNEQEMMGVDGGGFWTDCFNVLEAVGHGVAAFCGVGMALASSPAAIMVCGVCVGLAEMGSAVAEGMGYIAGKNDM